MIAATDNPQRKAQHGNAGTFLCGMGRAAPIADGYQFQLPRHSSRRDARAEKRRANCRGLQRTPAFFFTASIGHHVCQDLANAAEHVERLSSVRRLDDDEHKRGAFQNAGNSFQGQM